MKMFVKGVMVRAGRLALLTLLVLAWLTWLLSSCSGSEQSGPTPAVDPAYLHPEAKPSVGSSSQLDLSQPLVTSRGAVICPDRLILEMTFDRGEPSLYQQVMSMYTSIFDRDSAVKRLGCQEWRMGIPVYGAYRMQAPLDHFVAFSVRPGGDASFFTMAPHLQIDNERPAQKTPKGVSAQSSPPLPEGAAASTASGLSKEEMDSTILDIT